MQVDRVMDLLYSKYTRGLVSYDGIYRLETFPVPREAMREVVINAVIHRDYASATTIQIRVQDDRIAIWNAANLNPEWTAELLTEEMASRPHNPRIAYAFFRAGMIEAWGRGIRRVMDICREAVNPVPTWRLEPGGDGLWVQFLFSDTYQAADAAVRESGAWDTTQKTTQKSTRDRIIDCLGAEPRLTRAELAERVGLSPEGIKYYLRNLKADGLIRRVGSDRAGYWEVLK